MNEDNIVLITIDSLRADHVGCYGYPKETTPNLDSFKKDSVVFTEAIANGSHTPISFPAILTSSYASMYGDYGYLSEERLSIAEWLSKQGYSTAAFHSNPYLSSRCNYDKNFEVFYDSIHGNFSTSLSFKILDKLVEQAHEKKFVKDLMPHLLKIVSHYKPYAMPYEEAGKLTDRAIRWLEGRDGKFFLWIHYMDTHWPWIPHESLKGETVSEQDAYKFWWKMLIDPKSISDEELKKLVDLYDGEIRYLDHVLGEFFDILKDMGMYNNSLIMVLSDHGEELRDHGDIGHHNLKLYEEIIRVPFMIKFSNSMYAGTLVDELVSFLDLAPTVADCLNKSVPSKWLGSSLLSTLDKEEESKNKGVISEGNIKKGHAIVSYRDKRWKCIFNERNKKRELYDIKNDPKETNDLSEILTDVALKYESKIFEHLSKTRGIKISPPQIEDDESLEKRLRALGYI